MNERNTDSDGAVSSGAGGGTAELQSHRPASRQAKVINPPKIPPFPLQSMTSFTPQDAYAVAKAKADMAEAEMRAMTAQRETPTTSRRELGNTQPSEVLRSVIPEGFGASRRRSGITAETFPRLGITGGLGEEPNPATVAALTGTAASDGTPFKVTVPAPEIALPESASEKPKVSASKLDELRATLAAQKEERARANEEQTTTAQVAVPFRTTHPHHV